MWNVCGFFALLLRHKVSVAEWNYLRHIISHLHLAKMFQNAEDYISFFMYKDLITHLSPTPWLAVSLIPHILFIAVVARA